MSDREFEKDEIPKDIWDKTEKIRHERFHWKGPEEVALFVARAIHNERERCIAIMYAEREWGGELMEACHRIEKGLSARLIPGWNAPSED